MTKFAPHETLKIIAEGKLTFDERVIVHRAAKHYHHGLKRGITPSFQGCVPSRVAISPLLTRSAGTYLMRKRLSVEDFESLESRGSGSESDSCSRRIDFVYHSTLGLRVMKKKV